MRSAHKPNEEAWELGDGATGHPLTVTVKRLASTTPVVGFRLSGRVGTLVELDLAEAMDLRTLLDGHLPARAETAPLAAPLAEAEALQSEPPEPLSDPDAPEVKKGLFGFRGKKTEAPR